MTSIPADWTPPPRSLLYVNPLPADQGGGLEIGCDCGTVTHLVIEGAEKLTAPHETAFACDGCQSCHWLTIGPAPPPAPGSAG